jgi:putative sigma-54 modulation protein
MHIDLTGHHMDITDSLRNYVNEKMSRLERHFDNVTSSHVILSVEKLRHKAEATIQLNGSKVFADSTQENMYAAIDTLVDKLDRQVKKHKEKHAEERHRAEKPARAASAE